MAAKVSRVNENGSWILGNVLEYHAVPQLYEVQDEDDVNRLMHISEEGVKRLEDSASHLRKGLFLPNLQGRPLTTFSQHNMP